MANPPVRPWFRLTSIRPVHTPTPAPAPPPAPAPEPRPTLSLPTYRTSSAPSSPQTKPQDKTAQQHHSDKPSSPPRKTPYPQAHPSHPQPQDKTTTQRTRQPSSPARKTIPSSSSSSLPSSPIQKTSQSHSHSPPPPTSSPEKTTRQPISIPVPVPVRSPVHSPNSKSNIITTTPPPSPLTLPPSHFKPEQQQQQQQQPKIPMEPEHKAVLVQKTVLDKPNPHHNNSSVDKPNSHHHNNSSAESHRETRNAHHHGKHHIAAAKERDTKERKVLDSNDLGNMRVITIAGENKGAYMELIHSPMKHGPKYLHKKGNTKDGESEGCSAEEGNKNKDKNHKGRTTSSFPMAAYMNNNVQCVNNSLLYHASCSHHNPGLHLSLKKKPSAEGYHFKEHVNNHRDT